MLEIAGAVARLGGNEVVIDAPRRVDAGALPHEAVAISLRRTRADLDALAAVAVGADVGNIMAGRIERTLESEQPGHAGRKEISHRSVPCS
jgi:hypothetical protein